MSIGTDRLVGRGTKQLVASLPVGDGLQKRVPGVRVEDHVDLRRHVIREVEELAASGDGEEHRLRPLLDGKFRDRDRIVDRVEGASDFPAVWYVAV